MQRSILIYTFLFVVSFHNLFGQFIRFNHFDVKKGLPQNNINSLAIDSLGYIWIGTIEGLARFDGNNFDTFRSLPAKENTLEGNYINLLSACPNGNIWIYINDRGLNLYDVSTEKFQWIPDSCLSPAKTDYISSLVSYTDSILYFTTTTGIFKYNHLTTSTQLIKPPFRNGKIRYGGGNNLIYWGQKGIYKYSEKSWIKITDLRTVLASKIYNDSLITFVNSHDISILNLNNNKLRKLKINSKDFKFLCESLFSSIAGFKDEIWIGFNDGLVYLHNNNDSIEKLTKYTYDPFNNYSFHGNYARSLSFDKAGNLWIGTFKTGVVLYCRQNNIFNHHQISMLTKPDQEIDPVRAICKTSNGNIWVGFDRKGLVCIQPDQKQILYSQIHFLNGISKSLTNVRSIYEDSYGNLWIGTNKGLCVYNSQKNRIESTSVKFGWSWPDICYFLKEFTPGILTITNVYGIGVVDLQNGELSKVEMPKNYKTASLRSLVKDNNANYWFISADYGLCKLTPDRKLKYFTYEKNNLTDNKLYSLALIHDTLWISSNNGLMAFNITTEKVISRFYESNGLSNNLVYNIIPANNQLWMSTNRGISKLNLKDNSIEQYLNNDEFMDDAKFTDSDGTIYFGGYDGFISFNPEEIKKDTLLPAPILTGLYINNKKIYVGDKIKDQTILVSPIQKTKSIELEYNTNSFTLSFNAFPFDYPNKTHFRYRLKGLSSDWILAQNNSNTAIFTALPFGKYTFEVEASKNSLLWSSPCQLNIKITPPFYMATWFKTLCVLFIILATLITFKIKLYASKQRNIKLEKRVKEQTQSIENQKNKIIIQKEKMVELTKRLHEADQAKLKYYTNLSHEFRTPLTIIMGYLETLKEQGVNQYILKNIHLNSERLLRLINQFIDLRKYDQGELKLEITYFDIVSFTKSIVESFIDYAKRKDITINILNHQKFFVWLDKDKTDKIIFNILSNAIKYTDKNGQVQIDFLKNDDILTLRIADTGMGIPEKEQPNIYNRFFRSENISSNLDGHGMGLTLVKALVEAQHGEVNFTSKEGVGTTFNLLFKFGKEHFNKEDIIEENLTNQITASQNTAKISIDTGNPSGDSILIVEDNFELQEYLSNLLGKLYKIQTVSNGKEALHSLEKNLPNLIITDIMMPGIDGMQLTKTLKEKPETRFIPIIILSAKTDDSSKIEGFQKNIDAYIEKPFSPDLLLARVSNILSKHHQIRKDIEIFTKTNDNKLSKENKTFFQKIILSLEENYANPEFNAETLSDSIGMSRVTFYRKMKKLNQEGPGEFIRKYRLKKAASLIKEGNKNISVICNEVGFQSLSQFRKSFKDEYGVTPSEYKIKQGFS